MWWPKQLQALLGVLATGPIGPRSSHWGGLPQIQVKHTESKKHRKEKHRNTGTGTLSLKQWNTGTGTRPSRCRHTPAAPAPDREPPPLVMKSHHTRRKGELLRKDKLIAKRISFSIYSHSWSDQLKFQKQQNSGHWSKVVGMKEVVIPTLTLDLHCFSVAFKSLNLCYWEPIFTWPSISAAT